MQKITLEQLYDWLTNYNFNIDGIYTPDMVDDFETYININCEDTIEWNVEAAFIDDNGFVHFTDTYHGSCRIEFLGHIDPRT